MSEGARFIHGYLGYLLGQANHALFKDFDAQVRAAGLSSVEWRVLATLHDGPALTISQLAREVLSKQPTLTRIVQRMLAQGWVRLQADAQDQRRTLVEVTAAGRRKVLPLVQAAQSHERQVLASLGRSEKAALRCLIERLAPAHPGGVEAQTGKPARKSARASRA